MHVNVLIINTFTCIILEMSMFQGASWSESLFKFSQHAKNIVEPFYNSHLGDRRRGREVGGGGGYKELAIVERIKQESMYGLFVRWDKKVAVVEGWPLP